MDNFSYFHICDHRIKKPDNAEQIIDLNVRANDRQIHQVIHGGILLEIQEVRVLDYDEKDIEFDDFYYDNRDPEQHYDSLDPKNSYYDKPDEFIVDYSKYFGRGAKVSKPVPASYYAPVLHNRVKWYVKPPLLYRVRAKITYNQKMFDYYAPENCPICAGKGWFIDILNKDGGFDQAKGVFKIAQRVIKDILTSVETQMFDETYGTTIKKEIALFHGNKERLFDVIQMTVSSVENQYLDDQQEKINELDDEEILQQLTVEDISQAQTQHNGSRILLKLRILTIDEDQIFQVSMM